MMAHPTPQIFFGLNEASGDSLLPKPSDILRSCLFFEAKSISGEGSYNDFDKYLLMSME